MSFRENLLHLRSSHNMSQEQLAMLLGVSRQSVTKWESGKTLPDIERAAALSRILGIPLAELVQNSGPEPDQGPPRGKYLFGIAEVNDKGQIVIPKEARRVFNIKAGDRLVVLGDDAQGIALMKAEGFLALAEEVRKLQK